MSLDEFRQQCTNSQTDFEADQVLRWSQRNEAIMVGFKGGAVAVKSQFLAGRRVGCLPWACPALTDGCASAEPGEAGGLAGSLTSLWAEL